MGAAEQPSREQMERAIARLLDGRTGTICPSEAARLLADGADFRPLMQPVRDAAAAMAGRGELEVTQRGRVVDVREARGPVRLRRPRS